MERNNGVTAIIYLAFVRNTTSQLYCRSANEDAIFHSLTTFTFFQTPNGFKHPFQLGYWCASSWTLLERTEKERGKQRKKILYLLITDSLGIQRFPNMGSRRVKTFQ